MSLIKELSSNIQKCKCANVNAQRATLFQESTKRPMPVIRVQDKPVRQFRVTLEMAKMRYEGELGDWI